jgi:hypothetical protein
MLFASHWGDHQEWLNALFGQNGDSIALKPTIKSDRIIQFDNWGGSASPKSTFAVG